MPPAPPERLRVVVQPVVCRSDAAAAPAAARLPSASGLAGCAYAATAVALDFAPALFWDFTAARDGLRNLDELTEDAEVPSPCRRA
jgi:hypothetical protein